MARQVAVVSGLSRTAESAIATVVMSVVAVAAYANSFAVPFVFDDETAIAGNLTIRHLGDLATVFSPPVAETVGGRPLVNFSLAINYAISGLEVWSYHLVNLLIHLSAALLLFGILRRAYARVSFGKNAKAATGRWSTASLLALLTALLWLVHPLQTEAVTYIIQRAESLVSLCILLTLYLLIRASESSRPQRWLIGSIIACAAGMGCKEVMAGAPLLALLYDRTFISGTFAEAWRTRRNYYLGLAATWVLLAWSVLQHGRGNTAGFSGTVTVWSYLLTQAYAIPHYLRLVIWPDPLVLDYGYSIAGSPGQVAPYLALVIVLLAATIIALRRAPRAGFAGALFFIVLAPSSSVVPVLTQTIAEHRMYLPLAAVLALLVTGLYRVLGQWSMLVVIVWAGLLVARTHARNSDYQSRHTLWEQTTTAWPENARSHHSFARALMEEGDTTAARSELEAAIRIAPGYPGAQNDFGMLLGRRGEFGEAGKHFAAALAANPDLPDAHFNYGMVLLTEGKLPESIEHLQAVERLNQHYPNLYPVLGTALIRANRYQDAIVAFKAAATEAPDSVNFVVTLADLAFMLRRFPEAVEQYRIALGRNPAMPEVQMELGMALIESGRPVEAAAALEKALQLDPSLSQARVELNKLRAVRPLQPHE